MKNKYVYRWSNETRILMKKIPTISCKNFYSKMSYKTVTWEIGQKIKLITWRKYEK